MARIRNTKPEFWSHEDVVGVSRDARLLFIGMWNFMDANGVHPAKPVTMRLQVFPGDDDITPDMMAKWVGELLCAGLLVEFDADGKRYWHAPGFVRHQAIDPRKEKPKHPVPSNYKDLGRKVPDYSPTTPRLVPDQSPPNPGAVPLGIGVGIGIREQELERGAAEPLPPEPDSQEDESSQEPEPEPETPKSPPKVKAEAIPIPEELDTPEFRAVWFEWIADRRDRRLSIREKFLRDKLQAFVPHGPRACAAAMRESITQAYQGVFPESFDSTGFKRKGAKNGHDFRTGAGQRFPGSNAGTGVVHSGAAASGGYRGAHAEEAHAKGAAGGFVVNGRWVEAG